MATIILQGRQLTAVRAREAAQQLSGTLETRSDHYRVRTPRAPSAEALRRLRAMLPFDINFLPENFDPAGVRLLITDMDSTLINIECIDEIADFIGKKPQVAAITEAAMRGELNFEQSLTQRVALLAGLEASALEHVYRERLRPNPGAERMIAGLQARGIKVALVSGGFTYFTDKLKAQLGLDYARANTLEISDDRLTGRVLGTIVGAQGKLAFLSELCRELGITPLQSVAVGDGANDLLMMNAAGLSIAYHAKPKVQAQAHTALNHSTLEGVLTLLDASAA
ncbi:MAG: phosphoserine phosphatase SerB [Gammaproteobacteria bacterium]|jgi:phosphoserine phosphatase